MEIPGEDGWNFAYFLTRRSHAAEEEGRWRLLPYVRGRLLEPIVVEVKNYDVLGE